MRARPSTAEDATGISSVLTALATAGLRSKPADEAFVRDYYITHPSQIECSIAVDDAGTVLGFQSLKRAIPGNKYGVTPGWGVIGTHIHPNAHRLGAGRSLFAATRLAAMKAGLARIDATIGDTNSSGLAYYEAMGFRTYQIIEGAIRKVYDLK